MLSRHEEVKLTITCGIYWAEAHHDVALIDKQGVVLARSRIDTDAAGFSMLLALIAEHGGGPDDTPIAVETDKNLIVVALVEAGFVVYPINPRAVARYRERYGQAGGKSDPGDAAVLALSCAPIVICIVGCRPTRARPAQSKCSRVSTRRRSGRCIRLSADCGRCCLNSIRKRCRLFRI